MRPVIIHLTTIAATLSSALAASSSAYALSLTDVTAGAAINNGTKLRVLCAGDSITSGWMSSDGNGYRLKLQEDLSGKNILS